MEHAIGCFLGACIGDAGGAPLEFEHRELSASECGHCILMLPGGGPHRVAPGQITDDAELGIALARGILAFCAGTSGDDKGKPVRELSRCIAANYELWIHSKPFDIGMTTRNALVTGIAPTEPIGKRADAMIERAKSLNPNSLSNGFLMRCAPLAIFCVGRSLVEIKRICQQDLQLTHSHPFALDVLTCFVATVAELIRTRGHRESAIALAERLVKGSDASVSALGASDKKEKLVDWLNQAKADTRCAFFPSEGYVKIAFVEAFRHLYNGTTLIPALLDTCSGGGDTDTNCAIVGTMIGAADGVDKIPSDLVLRIISCDTSVGGVPRPDWLSPSTVPMLASKLYHRRSVKTC